MFNRRKVVPKPTGPWVAIPMHGYGEIFSNVMHVPTGFYYRDPRFTGDAWYNHHKDANRLADTLNATNFQPPAVR